MKSPLVLRIVSVANVVLWAEFIWVDLLWNDVIESAVVQRQGLYGELFGPISFFRPILLYTAFGLTVLLAVLTFFQKNKG